MCSMLCCISYMCIYNEIYYVLYIYTYLSLSIYIYHSTVAPLFLALPENDECMERFAYFSFRRLLMLHEIDECMQRLAYLLLLGSLDAF